MGLSAVTKAAGQPIAPFFRFPYLSDNRMIQNYVRQRQIATFFIDIDSKDFQTRDSNAVYEKIMRDLSHQRKGIILMHDIQPSTAGMIKRLLDTLHAKGFKVVHMVPKNAAGTLAEFDGGAAKAIKAKADALQGKPLADRSMVWTMTPDREGGAATKPAQAPAKPAQISTGSTTPAAEAAPAEGEVLPWTQNAAPGQAKKPAAPKKQVRRQIEDLPWQMHIFQN